MRLRICDLPVPKIKVVELVRTNEMANGSERFQIGAQFRAQLDR